MIRLAISFLVLIVGFSFGFTAWGQQVFPTSICSGLTGDELQTCIREQRNREDLNASKQKCDTANKEMLDAMRGDFTKNCGSGDVRECIRRLQTCRDCVGSTTSESAESRTCSRDRSSSDIQSTTSGVNGYNLSLGLGQGFDAVASQRRQRSKTLAYKNCPAYASEQLDEVREQREDFEKKKEEAKEELTELQAELGTLESENEKLQRDLAKAQNQMPQKILRVLNQGTEALSEEQERAQTDYNEFMQNQVASSRTEIDSAYNRAIDELNSYCYGIATTAVQTQDEIRRTRISENRLSAKDLNSLGSLDSIDNRRQEIARTSYKNCKKGMNYIEGTKRANESRANAIAALNRAIQSRQTQLQQALGDFGEQLIELQQDIQNATNCGQLNNDEARGICEEETENIEDLTNQIETKNTEITNKQNAVTQKQLQLQTYEGSYNEYLALERAAERYGRGGNLEVNAFMSGAQDFQAALTTAAIDCGCKSDGGSSLNDSTADSRCGNIEKYIGFFKNDANIDLGGLDRARSTTTTPTSTTRPERPANRRSGGNTTGAQ